MNYHISKCFHMSFHLYNVSNLRNVIVNMPCNLRHVEEHVHIEDNISRRLCSINSCNKHITNTFYMASVEWQIYFFFINLKSLCGSLWQKVTYVYCVFRKEKCSPLIFLYNVNRAGCYRHCMPCVRAMYSQALLRLYRHYGCWNPEG